MNDLDLCWLKNLGPLPGNLPDAPHITAQMEMESGLQALNRRTSFQIIAEGTGENYEISNENGIFFIEGGSRGCLYGVYKLLQGLCLKKSREEICGTSSPVFTYRMLNHWDNMDGTVERGYAGNSLFFDGNDFNYSPKRVALYARLLASIGINTVSINNVNVHPAAVKLITPAFLPQLSALASIFRSFGIRLLISVNFASPILISETATADPTVPEITEWWNERIKMIYKAVPDLAGLILKVDSEGQPGPLQYGLNHAQGANVLARALQPYGGILVWRAFVYNCGQDWRDQTIDRPKAAYDNYKPLDGQFEENILLQIKYGPYDFQVREPVSPLLGALHNTSEALELQLSQEYTGHQIDLYYMPPQWKEIFSFDTRLSSKSVTIADLCGGNNKIKAIAAVSNIGNDDNWTGHVLAQANWYAYGLLAWNPQADINSITKDWICLTFGEKAEPVIFDMLMKSRSIYEKYTSPLSLCFFVREHWHYGPAPEAYEFSRWGTYHRANHEAIGIDRTAAGTGFTQQYAEEIAKIFDDIHTCPEELLLFFHRVRYDYRLKNGETLLQHIYNSHFEGVDEVRQLQESWLTLEDEIAPEAFTNVTQRLARQYENAREWRDVVNTYFYRFTGIPDYYGRKIYE